MSDLSLELFDPCSEALRLSPGPRGVYKNKNKTGAMTAATTSAISRSRGVRIGLLRRGVHVAFGVGKFRIGRIIIFSYFVFRQWTPKIAGLAGFCLQENAPCPIASGVNLAVVPRFGFSRARLAPIKVPASLQLGSGHRLTKRLNARIKSVLAMRLY
jgi:hypothetical protein